MTTDALERRKQRVTDFANRLESLLRSAQEPDKPGMARLENHRGVLAALRSGLGGETARVLPHIAPYLDEYEDITDPWFLVVGALAGWHPQPRAPGTKPESLGETARALRINSESMTARFAALLACDEHDLPDHLRSIVGLLRGKDIPVDWRTLLRDLVFIGWNHPERRVQQRWARDFYRTPTDPPPSAPEPAAELSSDPTKGSG